TDEARRNVGAWLDALGRDLQARAVASIGAQLRLDGASGEALYRVQRASRSDLPDLVALLADDFHGASRESADLTAYEASFDAITRDPAHYLAVVRDAEERTVATMQLTVLPGLTRAGTTRLQLEGVRVASSHRGRGLGTAMLE